MPSVHSDSPSAAPRLSSTLKDLAALFLRLGAVGFGGPQAHMAMIHEEAVVQRGWFSEDQFLAGVTICEMLPGPASTQLGIYTGYLRGGILGALVAGTCFIAPAFCIVVSLSWAYFRYQGLPPIEHLFLGISPIIIAIILGFCWKLAKKGLHTWPSWGIALVVFLLTAQFSVNVLLEFMGAGVLGLLLYRPRARHPNQQNLLVWPLLPLVSTRISELTLLMTQPLALSSLWGWERLQEYGGQLFLFFLKVGSFIFGGGLVIIPLLETEVVQQFHWLTQSEFLDGVAIGELTPGPVVITAAFIGFKVAGILGAALATLAIFAPSFLFIIVAAPMLLRIRQNLWIQAFLKGVTPAVLGAIAAAAIPLARAALLHDTVTDSIFAISLSLMALFALIRWKTPTWQLVLVGGVAGLGFGTLLSVG